MYLPVYITVIVSISKWDSLEHSNNCSIYTCNCYNCERANVYSHVHTLYKYITSFRKQSITYRLQEKISTYSFIVVL